jgi:hypothetical protein
MKSLLLRILEFLGMEPHPAENRFLLIDIDVHADRSSPDEQFVRRNSLRWGLDGEAVSM